MIQSYSKAAASNHFVSCKNVLEGPRVELFPERGEESPPIIRYLESVED